MARVRKPILAVAELVWNCLDADATEVRVTFSKNKMAGLESVEVTDNGHGIAYEEAEPAFRNLGGSWKTQAGHSKNKRRLLHGKAGKGRFRAFSLGGEVTWQTRYLEDSTIREYDITGSRPDLGTFSISDRRLSADKGTGTTVVISNIEKNFPSMYGPDAVLEMTSYFALYLSQYSDVSIWYDDTKINVESVQDRTQDFRLESVALQDGRRVHPALTVIEWKTGADRSLYLCDAHGFTLAEVPPGIHARGFVFSAYLKCAVLRELDEKGTLVLEELDPDVRALLGAAKSKLRQYFRERSAQTAANKVKDWKQQGIYPFKGEPTSPIEQAKRQVFDVLALNVEEYLPAFDEAEPQSKRLSFRLLKHALEESPRAVQRIIGEVLELPQQKQRELADLLERTSLSAIINAAKVVSDRLDFLRILEILLFQYKERLLERSQLHKLLENETWIFGEEFSLSVSDKSLTEVLRKHLKHLQREELSPKPVTREDGSLGIVDLMVSRRIRQSHPEQLEHLVVELKRPAKPVDSEVIKQIKSYAFAVAEDERFRDTKTRWVFWAVSNELTKDARREVRQRNRPPGLLHDDDELRLRIWVKSWGEIIESCRARLEFFKKHLAYSPDGTSRSLWDNSHMKGIENDQRQTSNSPANRLDSRLPARQLRPRAHLRPRCRGRRFAWRPLRLQKQEHSNDPEAVRHCSPNSGRATLGRRISCSSGTAVCPA
jgi:hypothetical protein